jgi:hypothetical protein
MVIKLIGNIAWFSMNKIDLFSVYFTENNIENKIYPEW